MIKDDGTFAGPQTPKEPELVIKTFPRRVGDRDDKGRLITYDRIVKFEKSEWIKPTRFFPKEYDLVKAITSEDKYMKVWSTKSGWDGLKYTPKTPIYRWKRILEYGY